MKGEALLKMLEGGSLRSIGRSEEAAAEVLANPLLFKFLIRGMQGSDPVVRKRAADAAEKVTRHNPRLLEAHKKTILRRIGLIKQQEIRWHTAQMISRILWTAKDRRDLLPLLDDYVKDRSSIVRTCAMQALADMALQDEKLRKGIIKKLKDLTDSGTPAMRSRGKKLLLKLEQQK